MDDAMKINEDEENDSLEFEGGDRGTKSQKPPKSNATKTPVNILNVGTLMTPMKGNDSGYDPDLVSCKSEKEEDYH